MRHASFLLCMLACAVVLSSGCSQGTPVAMLTPDAQVATDSSTPITLLNPSLHTAQAPPTFVVEFETTKGRIVINVTRSWSPRGADRFYNLVQAGFMSDLAFFRVITGFIAQVGLHGTPAVNNAWIAVPVDDDPVVESNVRGTVAFATSGPDSRTTQFFLNFADNSRLDSLGFAPFGVIRDMTVADQLHAGYGESAPRGQGPVQDQIRSSGNVYLRANFPELDYITSARIVAP